MKAAGATSNAGAAMTSRGSTVADNAPVIASTDPALVEVADGADAVSHLDPDADEAWRAAIERVAGSRPEVTPSLPAGAITWDEHTDRLIAVARETVRSRSVRST